MRQAGCGVREVGTDPAQGVLLAFNTGGSEGEGSESEGGRGWRQRFD